MAGAAAYGVEDLRRQTDDGMQLNCAFDGGYFSGALPPDSPVDGDSLSPQLSGSESCDSDSFTDFAAIFRVFADSMLRTELAGLEIAKNRASFVLETERRRAESEFELTRMILQTQLQIASNIVRRDSSRKRKRIQEDNDSKRAMLLCLLQCNLMF